MDPLTSLSIASSAFQIIDFSSKFFRRVWELYDADNVAVPAHESLVQDAKTLRKMSARLGQLLASESPRHNLIETEQTVVSLCAECDSATEQLIDALSGLSINREENGLGGYGAKESNLKWKQPLDRGWDAVRCALKELLMRKDIEKLHQRVEATKQSLTMAILMNIQYVGCLL